MSYTTTWRCDRCDRILPNHEKPENQYWVHLGEPNSREIGADLCKSCFTIVKTDTTAAKLPSS